MSNNRAEMDDFKKLEALWNQIKSGDDIEGTPSGLTSDKNSYPVAERVDEIKERQGKPANEENESPVTEVPAEKAATEALSTEETPVADGPVEVEKTAETPAPEPEPESCPEPEGAGYVEEEKVEEYPRRDDSPPAVERRQEISAEPVVFPAGALKERQEGPSSSRAEPEPLSALGIRSMRIVFGAESSDWKLYLTGSDMSEIELNILHVRGKKQIEIDSLSFVFGGNEVEVKDSGKAGRAFDSMTFLSDSGEFIFDVSSEDNAFQTRGNRMQQLILEDVLFRVSPSEVHVRIEH